MNMSEEETIVTPNTTRLTKKNLEALSTQDAYLVRSPKNAVCSPTNSLCSQSTALSRARSEIEGRRKSRAAARARATAALDEIQSRNRDAKEKAWAALEQIQRSRSFGSRIGSMKSSSIEEEEEEMRQPVSLNLNQVEETREENEDRVGQVILVKSPSSNKSPSSKSKKHDKKADATSRNEKKVRYQENEKTRKDKKKRGPRSRGKSVQHEDFNKEQNERVEPSTNFVFTEEALLAVSQAAFEKLDTIASVDENDDQDENAGMEPEGIVNIDVAADLKSLASSKAKSQASKSNSSRMLSEPDMFAAIQDVQFDSFDPVENEHMSVDKYEIFDEVSEMHDTRRRKPIVSTASQASTQPYTKNAQGKSSSSTIVSEGSRFEHSSINVSDKIETPARFEHSSIDVSDKIETSRSTGEERKMFAQEPTPRVSNSSPVPHPERALSPVPVETASTSPDDVKPSTSAQNEDTLKSEEESSRHSSSSSSSWENEQTVNEQPSIEKKPSDIDKEMGALDSMMFQKKGLGQLKNAKPPPDVETGLTTNSEYSGHSSYSSDDNTNDLPLNKSMGPVWQKAIDNAQKALHSKSDKKSVGLVLVDDDSVADDDTVFTVKPGFNRERLQSVASFGVLFLLMNSIFVILDASSFAIRVFGLVGLISATFPLMVMCMFLMSTKTQHSFWLCSIKMLLIGSLCQVCTLILFICLEIGAGAGAVGFISLASLLALTVEMNTNSPVSIKPGKGDTPQLMIGDMMKCLVLFGLGTVDEPETNQRRIRRKKKKSRLLDRTLDEDDAGTETKKRSSESYMPPDIV